MDSIANVLLTNNGQRHDAIRLCHVGLHCQLSCCHLTVSSCHPAFCVTAAGSHSPTIDLWVGNVTTFNLRELQPDLSYRLYIWATTNAGRGEMYFIEENTVFDSGGYHLFSTENKLCWHQ